MSFFYHFDRYNCTFDRGLAHGDICRALQFIGAPAPTYPRARGYRQAVSFGDVAFLMSDPVAGDYGCHLLIAGGDTCQPVVDEVRAVLPLHRVSRVDVAADFDYDGAWADVEGAALSIALSHKPKPLTVDVAGKHYIPEQGGRCTYVGSRTSTHFLRVYEKGHEQRQKGINQDASIHWTRAEIEVKPTKKGDARLDAASMTPDQLAFSNAWCSDFSAKIGAECGTVARLSCQRVRTPFEDVLYHMARQYGPAIRRAIRSGETDRAKMMRFFRGEILRGPCVSTD